MKKLLRALDNIRALRNRPRPATEDQNQGPLRKTLPVPKFKTEHDMQRYFANHLDHIEPGLKLFTESPDSSMEFRCKLVEQGRPASIDILAVNRNHAVVVIETKLKNGLSYGFGQILGYMAWAKLWLRSRGTPAHVEGYLVCRRATPLLRLLLKEHPDVGVTVYEYDFELTVD